MVSQNADWRLHERSTFRTTLDGTSFLDWEPVAGRGEKRPELTDTSCVRPVGTTLRLADLTAPFLG